MPRVSLSDRFLERVRAAQRETYFDTKEHGLVLRVSPKAKAWYFVYRFAGKPPRWAALGRYPDMSLSEARAEALEHRRTINDGREPVIKRRLKEPPSEAPPAVFTFADMAQLYETFAKGRKRGWREDAQKIHKYLVPAWGTLPLRAITRTHVHELLDTLVAKGLTVGVNRVQALISRIFTIALDRGLVDAHPAARLIKRFAETAADRVLTDDEIRQLWTGLDQHATAAADAVRLRLLLGQRGGEIAGMRWAEVDFDARLWEIPGTRTKNTRPHSVPLPPTALAALERRRAAVAESEARVFPGLSLSSDDHRALAALHGGRYTWKDLRRTVATRLAALGFDEALIGRVLNHARYTVTARHYVKHAYLDEKRTAFQAWDRELAAILAGRTTITRMVLRHRPRPQNR
jgi:integrase